MKIVLIEILTLCGILKLISCFVAGGWCLDLFWIEQRLVQMADFSAAWDLENWKKCSVGEAPDGKF